MINRKRLFHTLQIDQLAQDGFFPSIHSARCAHSYDTQTWSNIGPIDAQPIACFHLPSAAQTRDVITHARQAFYRMRLIPAPQRGELVRRIGQIARARKSALADLITLESGKIRQEALGEVQELIDICDFAVGLSRQLHGLTIASERPLHRMMEQWHPLGVVVIISAFNFPMAVWAWNAMLALVCGNAIIWKPSEQTPLCALACQQLVNHALREMPKLPQTISTVLQGDKSVSSALIADKACALVSATGSCAMGRQVYQQVAARLGRCLLELGGNNAMVVTPSADLSLALRAIVFSAVGASGQRCTTLRRLIVHVAVAKQLIASLLDAYQSLRIGDPYADGITLGPLINMQAYEAMCSAMAQIRTQGGEILCGGQRVLAHVPGGGVYVKPVIARIAPDAPIVQQETFAPILYVMTYQTIAQAIEIQNNVAQGLSAAIFSENMHETELFMSAVGADCGIVNVNVGTSGAEIGGAFGGEKDTGGGRESGSDCWKNYMRRATNTINYGHALPLAQGIDFDSH